MTTPAQRRQQHYSRRIWFHNSLLGRTRHTVSVAQAVLQSETTTVEAKAIAITLESVALKLLEALRERNPDFEAVRKGEAS